ncbi:MAG: ABC transporter ATP-binding protein [Bacteroidota bacterium]
MNILETHRLFKSYDSGKTFALKDMNFSLKQGNICAVVGESGSGKTTLLRLIAGLERPEMGQIILQGREVSTQTKIVPPYERNVGMVFQSFALFPHLSVVKNVAYGLPKHQKQLAKEILARVNLAGLENRYPHQLSGGQQQRVAIARTLATNPQLLLLDEPFSNLDAALVSSLRHEIQQIVKQFSISAMFITHDMQDAIAISDEVCVLKEGQLIEYGTVQALARSPKTDYVKAIFDQLRSSASSVLDSLDL